MTVPDPFFLRNLWYFALPATALKPGKMLPKILLGEPVLFARKANGEIFALRDVCPHRAMPLSCGKFDGKEVECCYHGWTFDQQGTCTHIPSLTEHEDIKAENIKVRTYDVRQAQGGIWIFMADVKNPPAELPPLPLLPNIAADAKPAICEVMNFPCYLDHAVMGLMDPAHGPFVHTSWWWRTRKSIHEKAKAFGPSHLGFTMKRHKPSKNSFAYKILGGAPETEISFQLPGVRLESIQVGQNQVGGMTCVTPLSDTETEITHMIFTTIGWLKLAKPIVQIFARRFLGQDRDVVVKQQAGLHYEQNLLLVRDADTQARWYQQLKNEFARAAAEGRAFQNPVRDVTLRWRS